MAKNSGQWTGVRVGQGTVLGKEKSSICGVDGMPAVGGGLARVEGGLCGGETLPSSNDTSL